MNSIEVKNESGRIYYMANYDETNNWIYSNWFGSVTPNELMIACDLFLQFLEHHPTAYLLNDNSNLNGSWHNANEWIADVWTPKALEKGLKYFAHVLSPSYPAELSALEMEIMAEDLHIKLFKNYPEAEQWLNKCKKLNTIAA